MLSTQEHAQVLAQELKKATLEMKAAEARARRLTEELTRTLAQAKQEAEAARIVATYPTGRYECMACRQVMLLTEPAIELPACGNCGNRGYTGQAPVVTKSQPPAPKKYIAGMYECVGCGARTAVVIDTDEPSPCEMCGSTELTSI